MKQKLDIANVSDKFKAENQAQANIRVVRSDNGTEYITQKFEVQYKNANVSHQFIAPYRP